MSFKAFTGKVPFFQYPKTALIIRTLMKSDKMPLARQDLRERSPIEDDLWHDIWDFMTRCWCYDPAKRPITREARDFWKGLNTLDHRPSDPMLVHDMNASANMEYASVYRTLQEVQAVFPLLTRY
jgi:hypothetical protein